jgi:transcriptional regulator with XRE-family HTH domain
MDLIGIGGRVAELRTRHGISGRALADALGISRGYLSRVENGRQVPSIVILDRIAQHFGVELGYFFEAASTGEVATQPSIDRFAADFPPQATFAYEALCTSRSHKLAHPFLALFRPATRTQVAIHVAEYFRYVISGRVVFHYDGGRYPLGPGDVIYYDATVAHEIETVGSEPAKVLTLFIKPAQQAAAATRAPVVIEGHL